MPVDEADKGVDRPDPGWRGGVIVWNPGGGLMAEADVDVGGDRIGGRGGDMERNAEGWVEGVVDARCGGGDSLDGTIGGVAGFEGGESRPNEDIEVAD